MNVSRGVWVLLLSWVLLAPALSFGQAAKSGGGGATGGTMELFLNSGFLGFDSATSSMSLSPGIEFTPLAGWTWLQVGGELMYQKLSWLDGETKSLSIMLGPTINIGASVNDAVFVSIGLVSRSGSSTGTTDASTTSTTSTTTPAASPSGMGYYLMVGKRFSAGGRWCFRPAIGVISAGTSGLVLQPLGLSMFF